MPWVRKAGTPEYVNDLDVLAAQPTGGVNSWLQKFTPFFTSYQIDVNQLCAAGPPECAPVTNADFGSVSPNAIWTAINAALLAPKFDCLAKQMAFSTLCEFTAGPVCMLIDDVSVNWNWSQSPVIDVSSQTVVDLTYRVFGPSGNVGSISAQVYKVDNQAGANPVAFDSISNMTPGTVTHTGVILPAGTHWIKIGGAADGAGPGLISCELCLPAAGAGTSWAMPTVARPTAAIDPPAGTYPDIAALGAELDRIENKLHILLDANVGQELVALGALVPWSSVVALDNTTLVTLDATTVAVSLTVTTIAQDVDLDFGDPTRFHHLGWVYFGNEFGWLQPREISTSPLLVYPLPPGCDRLRVRVNGASTATLQRLMLGLPS